MLSALLVQQSSGSWEKAVSSPTLPLSLISAARQIPKEYKIKLFDARIEDEKDILVHLKQPGLLLAFSVLTGASIKNMLSFVKKAKAINHSLKILLGGIHPSILPEQTLACPLVDYIITGPGELPLKELIIQRSKNTGFNPRGIPGLGFKEENRIIINPKKHPDAKEINSWDLPNYKLVEIRKYLFDYNGKPTIYIESSRGCNHTCSFCSNVPLHNRWVPYLPERVVAHIRYLYENYGIKSFLFIDLDFFTDLERARRICELIIKEKLGISWHTQGVRVAELMQMKEDFINLLKESGFREFEAIGVESGSQHLINLIKKGFNVADLPKLNASFMNFAIPMRYNFMIGFPNETYEDTKQTIDMALTLNRQNPHASNSMFYIYTPYPGTEFYRQAIELGFKAPDNLQEWGNIQGWITSPIHGRKIQDRLERIHFLSIFTTMTYWSKFFRRYHILWLFFAVYRYIALFRLNKKFFRLMPEFLIWKFIRMR